MKLLDPQSALIPTAEVYQFLRDNPPRKPDTKIGSYPAVNLHNHQIVRSDLENYVTINHPHMKSYPPVDTFMEQLLRRLKPYNLTKAEAFNLINLGVGMSQDASDNDRLPGEDATAEEQPESELARSIFGLVVEESEQRFEGDEGERKINEILNILRESVQAKVHAAQPIANGHHDEVSEEQNGHT